MKELIINISEDFNNILGGREKQFVDFSGEEFREKLLDDNFVAYDKIRIELDGVLGYPMDFLDEVFGTIARQYGKELFWEKIELISNFTHVIERITYIVDHSVKVSK
jgi:hypothetical protein